MKRLLVVSLCALMPSLAWAEKAYVTERLNIPVYAGPADGAAVRTLDAGSALEVLERKERFARIRDSVGFDGWIETRYLTANVPARARVAALQDEGNRLRAQLADAQTRLKKAETALSQQAGRTEDLNRQLTAAKTTADKPAQPAPAGKPAETGPSRTPWAWLVLAFAMLILGFVAGLFWLRESIRRRSGGMYLRI